ncbi:DUF397 domain-containing protein [Thermomonospora umbrina]|uniref:Uncharacterized protein DUF397 n=1 Tax=Thermomonospora umbrina TaxID=111806 RepID=A0A3D9SQE1_9ACTN|nr:DUF397 domain-containing protein [Thermomonospora umbrina]REE97847.1 uncharacterized protein DUF397 [Thermomonospora umbrina]
MTEWRKSTRSNTSGGQCVEVADLDGNIGVRDSKNPHHGHLAIDRDAFRSLIQHVKTATPNA